MSQVALKLLRAPEAAKYLNLSTSTLAKWRCAKNNGPRFIKLGSAIRYDLGDLETFKRASSRQSTSEQVAA